MGILCAVVFFFFFSLFLFPSPSQSLLLSFSFPLSLSVSPSQSLSVPLNPSSLSKSILSQSLPPSLSFPVSPSLSLSFSLSLFFSLSLSPPLLRVLSAVCKPSMCCNLDPLFPPVCAYGVAFEESGNGISGGVALYRR